MEQRINDIINETKIYLHQLDKIYSTFIDAQINTKIFAPSSIKIEWHIEGLKENGSYVNDAFNDLNLLTQVRMKISNNIHVNVNIYHTKNDLILMTKCLRRIYCMLNIFGNQKYLHKYNDMTIDILMYDAPRIMTNHYQSSPNEMNDMWKEYYFNCTCGYATIHDNKFYICVSRKNTCLGLLTHELCHICELDLGYFDNDGNYQFPDEYFHSWHKYVRNNWDVDTKCYLGLFTEGINNANSSIIHAMFMALESKNPRTVSLLEKRYHKMLTREYIHDLTMVSNLLHWFKYKNLNELLVKNECKYIQHSLLLEYILLRAVYLTYFKKLGIFKRSLPLKTDGYYFAHFIQSLKEFAEIALPEPSKDRFISMEYYVE